MLLRSTALFLFMQPVKKCSRENYKICQPTKLIYFAMFILHHTVAISFAGEAILFTLRYARDFAAANACFVAEKVCR